MLSMAMDSNRRQYERLDISAEAIALDESGHRLGLVAQAGGGGMSITLDAGVSSHLFTCGKRLRITILEPARQIRHTLAVEVRYVTDNVVGTKFVNDCAAVF
jgi:hypothetical protein